MLSRYRCCYCDFEGKSLVYRLSVHSEGFVALHNPAPPALFSSPGYTKSIGSSLCLCPYSANLALCAIKAMSGGSLPGALIYGLVPPGSHPAVKGTEQKSWSAMDTVISLSYSLFPRSYFGPAGSRRGQEGVRLITGDRERWLYSHTGPLHFR